MFARRSGEVEVDRDHVVRLMPYHGVGTIGQKYTVTCDETGVIVLMPVEMDAALVRMEPVAYLGEQVSGTSQEDPLGVSLLPE